MLQEIQGKKVTVYLNPSAWTENRVRGEVIEINDSWLKLKGKKALVFVKIDTIRWFSVHTK